jgi:hypothetical protein
MKFQFYLAAVFLLSQSVSFSQQWATMMQNGNGNFYEIKADFENYWAVHDKDEKGKGYKAFKRWENFVERRVYPSGDLSLLGQTAINYQAFLEQNKTTGTGKTIGSGSNLIASATWTPLGPMGPISGSAGSQLLKSGRLNFITIDPTNSNKLWVGAPAGGLWSTTNGGTSWSTNTDNLAVIGCSDLAIDPTNTLVMYMATGDGDAGDTRSIGVLKSTNAGATWTTTGLTSVVSSNFLIRRLLINPSNTQILLAATNSGIYRTINGGTSWTQVTTNSTYDLEFKPGDPNTVYAAGTTLRISTNGGASFTQVTSGIATTGVNRMAIAVTPADVNYVYVLASNSTNSGLYGFYKSTNSGVSFTQMTTTVNLLGYSSFGTDTGGQGWYDLCIAASPLNKDEVVTGGVNVWRTTNGGTSWSLYSHWTGSNAPFSHADHHDLEYNSAGVLYGINDGTVYRRSGTTWTEISGTMNISQIYKIGMSSLTANKWITGHQDNGTAIFNGTNYVAAMGGDGMDCFIHRTNDNTMFAEYYNGTLNRSTNGGASWSSITSGLSGSAPWVTPWKQDPLVANTLYCGYQQLFKSTNLGTNWTQLTSMGGSGGIIEFAIAPSNNQVIYVLKTSGIYKTTNGGTSWTTVTGIVPVSSAAPQFISIDPTDPNNAWVVLSGYSAGNKVFMTTNGGSSWTNYSANLPNIPANCCVYQPGSSDMIYVGMDVGIYYRNSTSSNWTLYNTNLPNVPISDLEISPASPTLLHAATYGRGVWVASVIPGNQAPVSMFATTSSPKCVGSAITFTDQSSNLPTAWSWSITPNAGAVISSSVSQNPTITFISNGTYTVSFQASNGNGAGNIFSQVFTVSTTPTLNLAVTSVTACGGAAATFTVSGATSYTWSTGGGNGTVAYYYPSSLTVYTVTGSNGGCTSSRTVSAFPSPIPSVSIISPSSVCAGDSVILTATGAGSYTWSSPATGSVLTVIPNVTNTYSVVGSNVAGCMSSAMVQVIVFPLPTVAIQANDSLLCEGEAVELIASGASSYTWLPANLNGNFYNTTLNVPTTFTVTGADDNGCESPAVLTIMVDPCTDISLASRIPGITLFPNPVKDDLTILIEGSAANSLLIEIYDLLGKKVLQEKITFTTRVTNIDLRNLAQGIYVVKLDGGEGLTDTVKLIRE